MRSDIKRYHQRQAIDEANPETDPLHDRLAGVKRLGSPAVIGWEARVVFVWSQ